MLNPCRSRAVECTGSHSVTSARCRDRRRGALGLSVVGAIVALAVSPVAAQVDLAVGDLPAGKTLVVEIDVEVADPVVPLAGTVEVCSQGTVSGDGFADVLTDDPAVAGADDETCTRLTDGGDAPHDGATTFYPTSRADDGARHIVGSGVFLGQSVDPSRGTPTPDARGDDDDGNDDDDGVEFSQLLPGLQADVTVTASAPCLLSAWVDFNGDGDWNDVGEMVLDAHSVEAGANVIQVSVPGSAVSGTSYARFRCSTSPVASPTGLAPDGEVEDYQVAIAQVAEIPVTGPVAGSLFVLLLAATGWWLARGPRRLLQRMGPTWIVPLGVALAASMLAPAFAWSQTASGSNAPRLSPTPPEAARGGDVAGAAVVRSQPRSEDTARGQEKIAQGPVITSTQVDVGGPGGSELGSTPLEPGDGFTYRIVITNSGTDATNLSLSDLLDPNLVQIGAVRTSPLAFDDEYRTCADTTLVVDNSSPTLRGLVDNTDGDNDRDLDGDVITIVSPAIGVAPPTSAGGTWTLTDAATGTFTYTPPAGASGTDTFTYTIGDDDENQDTATVTVSLETCVETLQNDDGVCDVEIGCSSPDGSAGNPNQLVECFSSVLTPPFQLTEVSYQVGATGGAPDELLVEVYQWTGSGAPGAIVASTALPAGELGVGSHTVTLATPLDVPASGFCIGISGYATDDGYRLAKSQTISVPDASWLKAPSCGANDFTPMASIGFPGNWCIRGVVRR